MIWRGFKESLNFFDKPSKYQQLNADNYNKIITDLIGVRIIILDKQDYREAHNGLLRIFRNMPERYAEEEEEQRNMLSYDAIVNYFADVYRLKEFHKIENSNMTKIVAYEVYWIVRRKPIQVRDNQAVSSKMFANEGFATTFIAHEYLVPEEREPLRPEKEDAFFKYLRHVNYHLKYRCIDKQCLEIMLYSFETGKYIA